MKLIAVSVAFVCACLGNAASDPCGAGKTLKGDDVACTSCNAANCCMEDTGAEKCAGITANCAANQYQDTTKDSLDHKDDHTKCCTNKAKCGDATCKPGYKKVTGADNHVCPQNALSCQTDPQCCVKDDTKCGGKSVSCPAGKFNDPLKAGTTATNPQADCCTAQPICTAIGYSCPVGNKKKQNLGDLKCSEGLDTCPENCCEVDDTKCFSKHDTLDCGPDRKYDMNKHNVAHNNDPKKNCCKDWKNVCGAWKDSQGESSSARNISVFAAWLATAMVAVYSSR